MDEEILSSKTEHGEYTSAGKAFLSLPLLYVAVDYMACHCQIIHATWRYQILDQNFIAYILFNLGLVPKS